MKIVTWNMDYTKNQYASWKFLLETVKPDIALLQEVRLDYILANDFVSLSETADGLYYFCNNMSEAKEKEPKARIFWRESHTSVPHKSSQWGTAIYIAESLWDRKCSETPNLYPSGELRKGKMMLVKLGEFLFASVHIDTSRCLPVTGIDHLNNVFEDDLMSNENLIIGGDLNCDRKYKDGYFQKHFFQEFIDDKGKLFDCEPECKRTKLNCKTEIQDDHIFVSKRLKDAVILTDGYFSINWKPQIISNLSDHTIVEIELDLEKESQD